MATQPSWQRIARGVSSMHIYRDGARFVFVPLAIESFGRHGKQAMRFLSETGDMVAQGGWSKRTFMRQIRAELSCALVW